MLIRFVLANIAKGDSKAVTQRSELLAMEYPDTTCPTELPKWVRKRSTLNRGRLCDVIHVHAKSRIRTYARPTFLKDDGGLATRSWHPGDEMADGYIEPLEWTPCSRRR